MNDLGQSSPDGRAYICVYASSSCALDRKYVAAAELLGTAVATAGYSLVFGAGGVGLMGACARAVHEKGGFVVGVLPEALNLKGIAYPHCDTLHVTKTMRERKQLMEDYACGFIALPGGFGTLEELLEIITLKQLRYHNKPIAILNTDGFYTPLIEQFERTIAENFAKEASRSLYFIAESPQAAVEYIASYVPERTVEKWLTAVPGADEEVELNTHRNR